MYKSLFKNIIFDFGVVYKGLILVKVFIGLIVESGFGFFNFFLGFFIIWLFVSFIVNRYYNFD